MDTAHARSCVKLLCLPRSKWKWWWPVGDKITRYYPGNSSITRFCPGWFFVYHLQFDGRSLWPHRLDESGWWNFCKFDPLHAPARARCLCAAAVVAVAVKGARDFLAARWLFNFDVRTNFTVRLPAVACNSNLPSKRKHPQKSYWAVEEETQNKRRRLVLIFPSFSEKENFRPIPAQPSTPPGARSTLCLLSMKIDST